MNYIQFFNLFENKFKIELILHVSNIQNQILSLE